MLVHSLSTSHVSDYPRLVAPTRRKTSFEVDFAKVEIARSVLGTKSLTETIDAALDEVAKLRQRQELADLLFASGALELGDAEVMARAWR
jgi:hypothetical protein